MSSNLIWRDDDDGKKLTEAEVIANADKIEAMLAGLTTAEKVKVLSNMVHSLPHGRQDDIFRMMTGLPSGDVDHRAVCQACGHKAATVACRICQDGSDDCHFFCPGLRCQVEHFHHHERSGWISVAEADAEAKLKEAKESKEADGIDEIDARSLFDLPFPRDICLFCALPIPREHEESSYYSCCSNIICEGCCLKETAIRINEDLDWKCPFCRKSVDDKDTPEHLASRVDAKDAYATNTTAYCFENGERGHATDKAKAFELYLRAADLGFILSCDYVGRIYETEGEKFGVEPDEAKARYYTERAAKLGDIRARKRLIDKEYNNGNLAAAMKHLLLIAEDGNEIAREQVMMTYKEGFIGKDECARILRVSKNVWDAEQSEEREQAEKQN